MSSRSSGKKPSSIQNAKKLISKELAKREKNCNHKVIYEYKRPYINPYDKYDNVDLFKQENPFDTEKNCKILIDDGKLKTDKHSQYFKDIYTKARCRTANGVWNKKTVNRNNTYDMGNCWFDKDDAECGELLEDSKFLREENIPRDEIKKAQQICNSNDKCNLKRLAINKIDCVVKSKFIKEKEHISDNKSASSNIKSQSSSRKSISDKIDFNNMETSLYNLYNSKDAPETLKLIGTGNRCVEGYTEEDEEIHDDILDDIVIQNSNTQQQGPIIAQLDATRNITSMRKYISFNYTNYLRHIYFLILNTYPNISNPSNVKLLSLYINFDSNASITDMLNKFKNALDEYIKKFKTNYFMSRTNFDRIDKYAGALYDKYFTAYFYNPDTFTKEALDNYDYFQKLFIEYFIKTLDPNNKTDAAIIKYYMGDEYSDKRFDFFKKNYNRLYYQLKNLYLRLEKYPSEFDIIDNKIGLLDVDIENLYLSYFKNYITHEFAMEKERNYQIHQKFVRYSISVANPRQENFKLLFNKHSNYIPETSDITALEEFIEEYDSLYATRNATLEEYFYVYNKYFPDYFTLEELSFYNNFIKNKITNLDPNNIVNYNELAKYIDDKSKLKDFKRIYNLIEKDETSNYDNQMKRLYKKYFTRYFEDKELRSSSSSKSSYVSANSSNRPLLSSSLSSPHTEYVSPKIIIPKNPKLPTVPQSIINNICKTIYKNDLDKRGVLIWHSTGSGKTCTATSIMDGFWGTDKKIIYCSSVEAISSNPPINFYKCATDLFPQFAGKTLNETEKMFKNVLFLTFAKLANRIEKNQIKLDDCILIIDEVHNLFRPLITQRKHHQYLEKLLLSGSTKFPNLKVFILTATLGDNPSEIFKLLNIVRDTQTSEFLETDLKDVDEFKKKIRGLVSYFDMSNDTSKFPVVIDQEPKFIDMSKRQFNEYITKYKEVKDTAKDFDKLSKLNSLNKYWAAARRYSNTLYNLEKGMKLRDFSAKLEELLLEVEKYQNEKQYIYSAFYENKGYGGHGILAVSKQLEDKGYSRLSPTEAIKILNNPNREMEDKKPRYILAVSTQLGVNKGDDLDKMRALYNASFNKNGEYVQLFLASQNYNEGIDLKAVRHIHIFEPLITWASDKQTIGRAARLCSHADLDKGDWNVRIHRYMSNFPTNKIDHVNIDTRNEILAAIAELEAEEVKLKSGLKKYTDDNKNISKEITKYNKVNKDVSDLEDKFSINKTLIDNIKERIEKNKEELKLQKAQLKKYPDELAPKGRANKTIDASDIKNIDKFIFENSKSKMQHILSLYQAMKESAIDCQVLKKFHSSGNQEISCHKY
jgi:hypothetical protein